MENQANKIFSYLKKQFFTGTAKPLNNKQIINYSNHHADLTKYYVFREKLLNKYNINHAVINFYQIGEENLENMLLTNIVRELCGYIYFTELRIKQQLGYTTKGKVFSEGNIIVRLLINFSVLLDFNTRI